MDRGQGRGDRQGDRRDRGGDRGGRDRGPRDRESSLGKRAFEDRGGDRRQAAADSNGHLHFRMLVAVKKAGSVIGKGGDFIQLTRKMTGAKVAVDKALAMAEDRLVHVEGPDEPGKDLPGIQDAVLRTAERILGDESPEDATIKLPHKCLLRMLLYKHQVGPIMGKRGATINEIRNQSSASIKLTSPTGSGPVVPCALPDDELITIAGTPDQTLTALKMLTDKLRSMGPGPDGERGMHHDYGDRAQQADKRSRPEGPPPGFGGPPGAPPPHHLAPPPGSHPPGGNVISLALPFQARSVLDNNDSVKTDGLVGLTTVEYRFLVPVRRSGVILGNKGGIINDIRNRTGARVNLFDEEKGCGDRLLQIMSTEDVTDQHCSGFDAAMDCVQALLHDELATEQQGTIRVILPHGQVGAVMGKKGATIRELRALSGASLQLFSHPDVPSCVKSGEEVLEIRGPRNPVLLATHVVLVAVRGNMARGQLIYKYPLPHGAPPPTHRGQPPPHMGPPGDPHGGPPGPPMGPPLAHMQGPPGPEGRPRGSRWDSAEPRATSDPGMQPRQPLPLPPGAVVAGQPPPTVMYAQGPPPGGVPGAPPQPQVQYVQGPPPAAQVHYVQGPPPGQQQQPGAPPPQVVVYTSQPPPGSAAYAPPPQQQPPQQQQQPQTVYVQQQAPSGQQQQPGQPVQQVVEYGGAPGAPAYVQAPQALQQQQQPAPGQQQAVVYATAVPGQPPQYHIDPNTHQPVPIAQPQQVVTSGPPGATAVVHGQPPPQVAYVYAQAAPAGDAAAAAGAPAAAAPGSSGPPSGYGGLAGLMAAVGVPPVAAPAPAPAAAPPAPKARVLLTQDQVIKLRLNEPAQTAKLSALSGATITLSDHILENGAREVLLAGSDAECNTATNLMEALMRSAV